MKNNDFADIVFNRSAIKVYDKNVKISRQEMLEIINQAVRAPSAVNMQPWRFVVVDSAAGKRIIRPLIKYNTRQCDSSAAMIFVFGDMQCYQKAEQIYSTTVAKGFMPEHVKNELMDGFMPFYQNASKQTMNDIVKVDCSLAAMQLMLVARAHGYDTNPMSGFEKSKIAEALGLDADRYVPVLMISIGKADYKPHGTIRLPAEEVTTFK